MFLCISSKFICGHVTNKIKRFLCINFKTFIASRDAVLTLTLEELSDLVRYVELDIKQEELLEFVTKWAEEKEVPKLELEEILEWVPCKRRPAKVILAVGGWDSNGPTNLMEVYDRLSNSWSISPIKLPITSAYHGTEELGGNLYVVGGFDGTQYLDSTHCFNRSTMEWKEMSPMMTKRCYVSTTTLGGRLLALGGHDGSDRLQTVEIYDPQMNMWTEMPSMLHRRSDFAVIVYQEKVYAIGGFDGQEVLTSVECFDPKERKWEIVSNLSTGRSGVKAAVVDDKIVVVGGYDGTDRIASVESFSPGITRSVWHQVPDMLHRRSNYSLCVMEEKLLVIGGYKKDEGSTDGDVCANVETWNAKENTWIETDTMNIGKSALDTLIVESDHFVI